MSSLPYVTSPGNIDKALDGIKNASVPEKISQDFVKTILKIPGGSGDQMTTFLKKLGFANADGSPSEIYRKFRNPSSSGAAIAESIRRAYAPLYVRNEYMHKLNETDLQGLIVEETGHANDASPVRLTASCINHLKAFADFDKKTEIQSDPAKRVIEQEPAKAAEPRQRQPSEGKIGLNLGYTINLNLPPTSDPAVFDAIFKSLKANLLREDDA